MTRTVYLDESGDLGWNFNKPNKNGGSSRYLTLGYLIIPESKKKVTEKFVQRIYDKYNINPTSEKKGMKFSSHQRRVVAREIVKMMTANPDFRMGAITVAKEKVWPHVRTDGNKLYDYMIRQSVLDQICKYPHTKLIRDERTIKAQSDRSCIDYLQISLWFDYKVNSLIQDFPSPSHKHEGLILADWITNFVWSNYENGEKAAFTILAPKMKIQTLFFEPQLLSASNRLNGLK